MQRRCGDVASDSIRSARSARASGPFGFARATGDRRLASVMVLYHPRVGAHCNSGGQRHGEHFCFRPASLGLMRGEQLDGRRRRAPDRTCRPRSRRYR
jgi:hypothetical protein